MPDFTPMTTARFVLTVAGLVALMVAVTVLAVVVMSYA